MTAVTLSTCSLVHTTGVGVVVGREPHSGREQRVSLWLSSRRLISTGQLHTLLCFHVRPINPVVYWEPLTRKGYGNLILKRASRLDAFSGYHFRT